LNAFRKKTKNYITINEGLKVTHNVGNNIKKTELDKNVTGMALSTLTKKDADKLTRKHGNDIDIQPIWN
jgi:multimeric flavodoxin WrbA